jgi:outer membrane protein assembly factor BamB
VRRLILVLAGLAVLAGGVLAAFVIHRLQEGGNVRGSASTEYTRTTIDNRPPARANAVQWPTYGYDQEHTRSVDLPLRPPYRPVWTYHAGSLVEFPPAVGYGRLYFATNSGRLVAISEKTGSRAWIFKAHRCVAASPTLGPHAHGTVYEVFLNTPPCNAQGHGHGVDGKVMAISAGNRHVHWQHTIGPSETSPLLVKDRLYVGDWNGVVWAFDANHGRVLWRHRVGGAVKGAIARSGNRLFLGAYDGHVYCLSAKDGHVIWRASGRPRLYGKARFYSTPTIAYGRVFIGGTDGKVYAFGATSGHLLWAHDTGGYVYASPAVWRQEVLIGSYSKRFIAFDAATGDVRWSFKANGKISGSATVVGNVVYFATLAGKKEGRTYALAARSGSQLWTFPDGKYTPVVAVPGRLFLIGYARVYGMVPK